MSEILKGKGVEYEYDRFTGPPCNVREFIPCDFTIVTDSMSGSHYTSFWIFFLFFFFFTEFTSNLGGLKFKSRFSFSFVF